MTSTATHRRSPFLSALLISVACFVALSLYLRNAQRIAIGSSTQSLDSSISPPIPSEDVAAALVAMKLITVEIDTSVTVQRGDRNWRGSIQATVNVPVRLRYGTDLSRLTSKQIVFSPIAEDRSGLLVIEIPKPTLLGTEIFAENEHVEVDAAGLRFRSMSGEYYLGLARRDVAEAARALKLTAADAEKVEAMTRQQMNALVSRIAGDTVHVIVRFAESN